MNQTQQSAKNLPPKPCLDSTTAPTLPESEATNSVNSRNVERPKKNLKRYIKVKQKVPRKTQTKPKRKVKTLTLVLVYSK